MAQLTVRLLGPLEVALDGDPVSGFATDKVRALLAYLVVEAGRPHRREKLAGLLWPNRPEPSARANLRRALSNLRQAIGDREADPPYLHVSRQTIQLNGASDEWVDVAAFTQRARPQDNDQGTINLLEEAVALYRGPFLEGFTLADSAALEEWVLFQRERHSRLALEALSRLAEGYEARGAYGPGLKCARQWVALAPLEEKAHQQVMRLLARSGRRAAALSRYEACRQALAEELGAEPSAETTRLYERIRDGEIGAAGEERGTRHNLPPQLTPFVGRRAPLSRIRERVKDPACRLVTLVGPGGSGKTRLALEVASGFVADETESPPEHTGFPDGIYFVPLAHLSSVDAIVLSIGQALQFHYAPAGAPRDQLLGYLRGKRLLLILDNYEHLLACPEGTRRNGVGVVTDILAAAPDVKILTTSRTALNVRGEQLYPIGGMDLPPSLDGGTAPLEEVSAPDVLQYSAVRLFVDAAHRARPDFDPAGEGAQIARICRLVEGLPLAILLAAAWVRVLTPAEIGDEIQQSYDFLETHLRDAPERHTSMRAVYNHSWNLLSERQREALAGFSVFLGGCTREAAEQVTGASLRDLAALVDRSLLQRAPDGRYAMHELLRQYTAEKLAHIPRAEDTVRDRHCAHYAAEMNKWLEAWKGPGQRAARAEMEADLENMRAAWDWAVERGYVERLGQAIDVLGLFNLQRHHDYTRWEAALRAAAEMLAAAEARSPATSADRLRVWAKVLAWQGALSWGTDRAESAVQLGERSLEILAHPALASQDVRMERAVVLYLKGLSAGRMVDRGAGRVPYEQSLALCRELGDPFWTTRLLSGLGSMARMAGSLKEGRRLHQEALDLYRALGNQEGIVNTLVFLGVALMHLGCYQDAENLQREAVTLCREMDHQDLLDLARCHLALTLICRGQYVESHSLLQTSMTRREGMASSILLGHISAKLVHALLHLGQYARARAWGRTGHTLGKEMNDAWVMGCALHALGRVALAEGAHGEAQRMLRESVDVLCESKNQDFAVLALASLAHAELALGHLDRARQRLRDTLRLALAQGHGHAVMSALPVMALLLASEGNAQRAIEVYALASRYGHVANSRWWKDVAGRQIAALAATLPPDAVAAAQERGRARDLEGTAQEWLVEAGAYRQ
jgi:DNA-binding SARP family transcriptional activator/predicted ATPase